MSFRVYLVLFAVVLLSVPLFAQSPGFAKDPAISPDGNEVCFVYANDLWKVSFKGGIASRLTDTSASEWGPIWSPDGQWIAFKSNREGRTYSYIMPSSGGDARVIIRETYSVVDWFNDGENLLAIGYGFEHGSSFYKLPINGERPELLGEIADYWASLSADNSKIIFSRYGDAHRESYRGPLNGDLHLYDIESKSYSRLTDTEYTERYPVYSHFSNSIFYAMSDGDNYQLVRVDDLDFERIFKASDLPRFSVRDISIARSNDRLVFEHFNEIYKYDPTKISRDRVEKLQIDLALDIWENPIREHGMKDEISDYAVSKSGKLISFNYKFDNFVVPAKGGEPKALTGDHSGWAKTEFIDDRNLILFKLHKGKDTLFRARIDKEISLEPVRWFGADSLSVNNINRDEFGRWQIRYRDHKNAGRIALADSSFQKIRPMDIDELVISNFSINKSGSHAAYVTLDDKHFMRGLYIYDFASDSHRKVLSDQYNISNIHWTKDNRSLIFTRNRNLYRLDLLPRDEFEYDEDPWAEILNPQTETDSSKAETQDDAAPEIDDVTVDEDGLYVMEIKIEPEAETPVAIEWEGIDKRLYLLYEGQSSNLYPIKVLSDSTFLFVEQSWFNTSKAGLYKGDIYGKNKKEEATFSTESNSFKLYGDTLYYLEKGALKSYGLDKGKRKDIHIALDYSYDESKMNQKVFEQAWGNFADNFYDPNMHGMDWNELYEEYLPYAQKALNINEIAAVIDEMVGDLNASHTGFTPRADEDSSYKSIAYLGVEFDYSETLKKGIRISKVYPNTRLSAFYKVKEGDLLTQLDDVDIDRYTPIDSLLVGKVGKIISFKIERDGEIISGQLSGIDGRAARKLWCDYKTERNRQLVENATGGRVGYIHVPAMGEQNYEDFTRDFYRDNHDKEAIILDFRGNVGGRIHDKIISLLTREPYAYSTRRSYGNLPRVEPRDGIYVPTVVLVDERSFSDGEIFPIIYRELKLGKVIGYPSSGAVIGTWEMQLLDGSSMRMPGTGWYKVDGTNMEGNGAMPDIIVEHSLNDIRDNNDKQLQRAIAEILKEINR
ncbi:MAG: S41 family peptidase [Candidatus Cloacimonadaceae bacterium]|nr:S41 family peptidase [Candidatus Cloacimonadaceae bacterium]